MKVLIIHNEYKKRGGEENVVEMQIQAFRQAGWEVITFIRSYSEIERWPFGRIRSFFTALHNRKACKEVRQLVRQERPDVAFVHNLFPVISPAVLPILKEEGVRTMMFVHNFRLLCPIGLCYREGTICEACAGKGRELNCIRGKCEGSTIGSIAFAGRSYWARVRKYYLNGVDHFVCLTRFQKEKLASVLDLPVDRFAVIPNAIDASAFPPLMAEVRRSYFAFVGRLSPEKGVELFFELARRLPQYSFKVAGEKSYELGDLPPNVELLGFLNREELSDFYSGAYATILTSLCYEGFPLILLESALYQTPVLVPDNANLRSILQDYSLGKLYQADRIESLVETAEEVVADRSISLTIDSDSFDRQFSVAAYVQNIEKALLTNRNVKFSIITVCYNAEQFILPTLLSVLNQRYPNVEYLIIDGDSTDKTLSLIDPYRDRIATVVSEPDKGIYDAMNKGLQRAKGDYVLFLNAGDQFFDDRVLLRLAEQLLFQKELPTVIYGDTALLNEQREMIGMRRLRPPQRLTWRSFRMGMLVCHQSFVVRRDIAPLYDLNYRLSSDFDWCVRCLKAKGRVWNSRLVISSYLEGGVSVQRHKESLKERFFIMTKWYGWVLTALHHLYFAVRMIIKEKY